MPTTTQSGGTSPSPHSGRANFSNVLDEYEHGAEGNDMDNNENSKQQNAAERLLQSIERIGGLFVAVGLVAYFVGWLEVRSYLIRFNAVWLLPVLPASYFLHMLPSCLMIFCIGFAYGNVASESSTRWLKIVTWSGLLVGILLMVPGFIIETGYFSKLPLSSLILLAEVCFGMSFAAAIARRIRWGTNLVTSANSYFVLLVLNGLLTAPILMGLSFGKIDVNPEKTTLPEVVADGDRFRVLAVLSDNYVLVKLSRDEPPIIKLVGFDKVAGVQRKDAKH